VIDILKEGEASMPLAELRRIRGVTFRGSDDNLIWDS
jgi:hypothetical protein